AIRKFDQVRGLDAGEYSRLGLGGRRDEAVRGQTVRLIDDARAAVQALRFRDAQAKLREVEQLTPGQKAVADLEAEIKRHEDDYQRLKPGAESDVSAKNYGGAADKLRQAQAVNPERFTADGLARRLSDVRAMASAPPAAPGPATPPPSPNVPAKPPANVIE